MIEGRCDSRYNPRIIATGPWLLTAGRHRRPSIPARRRPGARWAGGGEKEANVGHGADGNDCVGAAKRDWPSAAFEKASRRCRHAIDGTCRLVHTHHVHPPSTPTTHHPPDPLLAAAALLHAPLLVSPRGAHHPSRRDEAPAALDRSRDAAAAAAVLVFGRRRGGRQRVRDKRTRACSRFSHTPLKRNRRIPQQQGSGHQQPTSEWMEGCNAGPQAAPLWSRYRRLLPTTTDRPSLIIPAPGSRSSLGRPRHRPPFAAPSTRWMGVCG